MPRGHSIFKVTLLFLSSALWLVRGFAAPPANDNFASRTVLGTGVAATVSTVEATKEGAETAPSWLATNRYQKSVWWKWTAPSAGWYQATTSGSEADTVLTVNTGAALNALTLIQANDQDMRANLGLISELLPNYELPGARILFQATAGTEYQIAVATSSVDAGLVRLKVEAAAAPSPRLTAFSLPATVNANGAIPVGTATASISSLSPFLKGVMILYSRVNGYQSRVPAFTAANRISGDALNGTYSFPFNPQFRSPPATMEWQLILEADADAEISSYGLRGQTPPPAGSSASLAVTNSGTVDSTAPVIASFDLSTATIDITTGTQTITATIRVTDATAGVKTVQYSLIDSAGREYLRTSLSRTSGTVNDGMYVSASDFPIDLKVGTYNVRVWAADFAGNVSAPTGPGVGGWPGPFAGTVQINRTNTIALSSLVITPATVDVTNGPQTVTIDVNVASGGPTAAIFTIWPAMAAEPLLNTFAPNVIASSGNPNVVQTANGWRATIVLPKGYPPGLALLGVQLSKSGIFSFFGPRFNLPFPSGNPGGVTVINDGIPDLRPPKVEYTATTNDPFVRSGVAGDGTYCAVRVTDDASGVADTAVASVGLRKADYSVSGYYSALRSTDRIRGNDRDGTYRFFMLVESFNHAPFAAGDYVMETIMTDRVGRQTTIPRTKVFKLATPPAAYTSWVNSYFPGLNGNPLAFLTWAPYANPDNDAAVNLAEAYFDTNPTIAQTLPPPVPGPLPGEISATWIEPAATHGLTVTPYWSPDLVAWMASGEALRDWPARALTVESLGPVAGGTQKRVRMSNAGLAKAFLRLQVVPAP